MPDEEKDSQSIETKAKGGINIIGDVNTEGGDFVGRDLLIAKAGDDTVDIGRIEERPYIIRVTEEGSTFGSVYTAGGHFIGRDLIINNLEVKDIEHLRPEPCLPPVNLLTKGCFVMKRETRTVFLAELT